MENFSLEGISLSVFFDTRRVKDDLTFPVKYRITYRRDRVYHAAGVDLTEEEWKILPTTRKKELIDKRELIQSGFDKLKSHIKELVKGEDFSWQGLNTRLKRKTSNSILSEFAGKIDRLEMEGRPGSASAYRCAINSIKQFTSRDLKFTDITPDWLSRYERHMIDEGRSMTTVGMYTRCLRSIMNEGKNFITPAQYPFGKGKYEIKTGSSRKLALTLSQIGAVLKYELSTDVEKRCRDLWFFSYLCNGINFSDLLRLKYKDIAGGEIHFIRQKTKRTSKEQKEISATLLPQMQEIIDRWGTKDRKPDSFIFPFLSHGLKPVVEKMIVQNTIRLVNKKLHSIGEALGIGKISTYSARHSFASVLKRSGSNIAFISESLGHSDLKTTETYLASFEQEERSRNASKLLNF
jgi:integrase